LKGKYQIDVVVAYFRDSCQLMEYFEGANTQSTLIHCLSKQFSLCCYVYTSCLPTFQNDTK